MTTREAVLSGTNEANRLHTHLESETAINSRRGSVDVFGAILKSKAMLVFRPLEGLLGACLSEPARGVIISTQRPLSVQRFTGAHELGHVVMHHPLSTDGEEILKGQSEQKSMMEVQANAFASAFLIPYWLLVLHAQTQGWDRESVKDPTTVYQLSLRIGASYEATAIALKTHKLISDATLAQLRSVQPKAIKQKLLPGYEPDNWFRDVWLLTEKDENGVLEGQPGDLFLFCLNEKSGSGYLWDIETLEKEGFAILRDSRNVDSTSEEIGSDVLRKIMAHPEAKTVGEVLLAQRRPWQHLGMPADSLHLNYDVRGKETGYSRAYRRQLEAA
jgi:Zn-dependent peptidase ImmA (M78 family)